MINDKITLIHFLNKHIHNELFSGVMKTDITTILSNKSLIHS